MQSDLSAVSQRSIAIESHSAATFDRLQHGNDRYLDQVSDPVPPSDREEAGDRQPPASASVISESNSERLSPPNRMSSDQSTETLSDGISQWGKSHVTLPKKQGKSKSLIMRNASLEALPNGMFV